MTAPAGWRTRLARAAGKDVTLMLEGWQPPEHARYRGTKRVIATALSLPRTRPAEVRTTSTGGAPAELVGELVDLEGRLVAAVTALQLSVWQQRDEQDAAWQERLEAVERDAAGRLAELVQAHAAALEDQRARIVELERVALRHRAWLEQVPLVVGSAPVVLDPGPSDAVLWDLADGAQDRVARVQAVPTDAGVLLCDAADTEVAPSMRDHGLWARAEADEIARHLEPGSLFVDVGSHVGYHALRAALVVPDLQVVAVEADPWLAGLVRRNADLNLGQGAAAVTVHAVAAWDEEGQVRLTSDEHGNAGDKRVLRDAGADGSEVPARRLDDVLADRTRRVSVIKTDCQGRDHIALRGAREVVERDRPVLVMEFWPDAVEEVGDDPHQVLEDLRALGLHVDALERGPDADDRDLVALARSLPGGACTLVARPVEALSPAAQER